MRIKSIVRNLTLILCALLVISCGEPLYKGKSITRPKNGKITAHARAKKILEKLNNREKKEMDVFIDDIKVLKDVNPFSPDRRRGNLYVLTGIIWHGEKRAAIINNKIVKKGDVVLDRVVEEITDDKVILTRDGEKQVVFLNP